MKRKLLAIVGALLIACSSPLSSVAASKQPFPDVPATKHFAKAVNELAERNIIGGYPDGTFKPGNNITRGQAAAIIAKMINLDMKDVKNPGYKDVSTKNGYYKAIAAMSKEGIIGGYGDGRYGPNDPITRGQMASIIVKAFDLPRYAYSESNDPFKDIVTSASHRQSILIIYTLGITTGTTQTTYSPNTAITRGQAAKMLRTTEEAKPEIMTIKSSDLKWKAIQIVQWDPKNSYFNAIHVPGKEGYTEDKIQLIPLKEGKSILSVRDNSNAGNSEVKTKKYEVIVKKTNGKLKISTKETKAMLPTLVELGSMYKSDSKHHIVENISLSTMDGKKIVDQVPFKMNESNYAEIYIDQPGEFIVTVRWKNGDIDRYGIISTSYDSEVYYYIQTLLENKTVVYEEVAEYEGGYTLRGDHAEDIAEITRDSSSKTLKLKVTGKKPGTINVQYDHYLKRNVCNGVQEYTCTDEWDGLVVRVTTLGSIMNVSVHKDINNR